MRVLYHHRTLADGAEGVHIQAMVTALQSLGHEVRVLGVLPRAGGASGRRSMVSSLRAKAPPVLFELLSLLLNVPDYFRVAYEIYRFQPDVIYKRHARFDVGTLVAARHVGIGTLLEVNCLFSQPPYATFEPQTLKRTAAWAERTSLRAASVVLAVSSPLAAQIAAISHRKVKVLPNGADTRRFDPAIANPQRVRDAYHLGGRPVVGWVGVLRNWHGMELLLEAMAGVPGAHLLIVGDGPNRGEVERRTAELGLLDRLTITGRIPHDAMPDFIAAMDVAVVADDRTAVASPMKLLEYMAMSRAVVAPALDNIRDVVTDRATGVLFRPGDAADLRERLHELLADAPLRQRLGSNARAITVDQRNWRSIAESVIRLAVK